jgi:hypothetical protein
MSTSQQFSYSTSNSKYISHSRHSSHQDTSQVPFADMSRGSTPSVMDHPLATYSIPTWTHTDSDAVSIAYSHDDDTWLYEPGHSPSYMLDSSYAETSTDSSPRLPSRLSSCAAHTRPSSRSPATPSSQLDDIRKPVEWHVYTMENGGRRSQSASSMESDAQRHTVSATI